MALLSTLRYMNAHPLTRNKPVANFARLLRWQLGSRLLPYPILVPFVGSTRLAAVKGQTGSTGNIYTGLHEFEDMAFVLHVLRPQDLFLDIGANIGAYSVIASGAVGARTIAFEPDTEAAGWFNLNVAVNAIGAKVELRQVALAATRGSVQFTEKAGPGNHVAVADDLVSVTVPARTLDDEMCDATPNVMKIDVEGFETAVFDGAAKTLSKATLKCIIAELNGLGAKYGYVEGALRKRLEAQGFAAYSYRPLQRTLVAEQTGTADNVLFVRDIDWVVSRVSSSPAYSVAGTSV